MVGIVASSYYREPSLGKKGNAPTLTTFHQTKGFVEQSVVVNSIKKIFST